MTFKKKIEQLDRLTPEEFNRVQKFPLVFAADNIRSGHNVGSLFRTADAFRFESIVLSPYCAKPPHPEILKTALGAHQYIHWEGDLSLETKLLEYKSNGYILVAFEHCFQSIPMQQFEVSNQKKYVLVFGHEVEGVREEILSLMDVILEIPQFGVKHSLNVSVAAGIAAWHFVKAYL